MKHGKAPDPNAIHPIAGYDKEIYIKPTIQNPNITVGDFTYIADSEFESHVTNFYPWSRDKLIIGKFCQIATGVEFIMNDANHQMAGFHADMGHDHQGDTLIQTRNHHACRQEHGTCHHSPG